MFKFTPLVRLAKKINYQMRSRTIQSLFSSIREIDSYVDTDWKKYIVEDVGLVKVKILSDELDNIDMCIVTWPSGIINTHKRDNCIIKILDGELKENNSKKILKKGDIALFHQCDYGHEIENINDSNTITLQTYISDNKEYDSLTNILKKEFRNKVAYF